MVVSVKSIRRPGERDLERDLAVVVVVVLLILPILPILLLLFRLGDMDLDLLGLKIGDDNNVFEPVLLLLLLFDVALFVGI